MTRLVQLAGWVSPTSGGVRTVLAHLGAGYREAGHDVVAVVPGPRDRRDATRIVLRAPRLPGSGGYRFLLQRSRLAEVLAASRPDVVEVHDKFWLGAAARWARPRGVPVVTVTHERLDVTLPLLFPAVPPAWSAAVAAHLHEQVVSMSDVVVAASDFAAAEFAHEPVPVRRVGLGVDPAAFRPGPGGAADHVRLLLASRLSREKRPAVAVEAVRELRRSGVDARLTVLGTGPLQRALEVLARGLPVTFEGFVPDRGRVRALLSGSDVVLAPGPAETFGLAALEALACGTPVVATAGAAVAELVAGTAGGRVAAGEPGPFAAAVRELLTLPAARRRAAARRIAEGRTWERTTGGFLEVHAEVQDRARLVTPAGTVLTS